MSNEDLEYDEEMEDDDDSLYDFSDYDFSNTVISCEEGRECEPWESKLGGCPYMHSAEEYPVDKNGVPMLFLLQINLKDIHNIAALPKTGLLQFFIPQDNGDCYGLFKKNPPVVRWIENVEESKEELILENPFADEKYQEDFPLWNEPGKLDFEEGGDDEEEAAAENSRMGGYPHIVQDGELEASQFLLLQLASDIVGWGDCGVFYFYIELEDLSKCDFSKVWFDAQCG